MGAHSTRRMGERSVYPPQLYENTMKYSLLIFAAAAFSANVAWASPDSSYCQLMPMVAPASKKIVLEISTPDRACDLKTLIENVIKSGDLKKSEFENNDSYNLRVTRQLNTVLIPGIRPASPFSIFIPIHPMLIEYDADKEVFRAPYPSMTKVENFTLARLVLNEMDNSNFKNFYFIGLSDQIKKTSYDATTVLGVKFIVIRADGDAWGISLRSGFEPGISDPFPALSVPSSDAQSVKNRLAFVITGTVVPPVAIILLSAHEATLNAPNEFIIHLHTLFFRATHAKVIRTDTGDVLADGTFDSGGRLKWTATSALPPAAKPVTAKQTKPLTK